MVVGAAVAVALWSPGVAPGASAQTTLAITSALPLNGIVGHLYAHQFTSTPSTPRATYSVTSGALPPGNTMNPGGIMAGAGTVAGTFGPTTVCASNGVSADACQTFTITFVKRAPSVFATTSAGGPVGTPVRDVGSLVFAYTPTGTMTFRLYNDDTCTNEVFSSTNPVDVTGLATSGDFIPTQPGTYRWVVSYSGDANNEPGAWACNGFNQVVITGTTTSTSSRYIPLTPARILDTRDGTGGISAPVGPGASVDVQITGKGGVPATGVSAVAMNVTVTQPTASGWLTLSPAGAPRPLAANLNFTPGLTMPNLVVVKLGAGGKMALSNSAGSSHVIFDVAGWYSEVPTGNDGRFQSLVPARILDTRDGTGGGVRLGPGASLDLQVAGRGGVPSSGAAAAVLNVAVTGTTATSFLTVYPTGQSRPLAANLNFTAGDTVSNRVMAKLGAGGKLTIYNHSGSADVVVDVNGWYTDSSVAGSSGVYNPLVPARILDTRDGTGGIAGARAANSTVDVQVTGQGGVPVSGVSAVILNVTVTQPAANGFLTLFPAGTAQPLASDLNYAGSETRPNLVVVKVGAGGKVGLYAWAGTHVVVDVAGWYAT